MHHQSPGEMKKWYSNQFKLLSNFENSFICKLKTLFQKTL